VTVGPCRRTPGGAEHEGVKTGERVKTGRRSGLQARTLTVREPVREAIETDLTRLAQETSA